MALIRRLLTLALIGWFAVVAAGLPLPVDAPRDSTDAGERYPCERCPCGCATAEHCWKSCCCHSLAERLAWARREGVRPPEAALTDAVVQGLDVSEWVGGTFERKESREVAAAKPASGCCCCSRDGRCAPSAAKQPPPNRSVSKRSVVVLRALQCQGLALTWQTFNLDVPPPLAEVSIPMAEQPVTIAWLPPTTAIPPAPDPPPPQLSPLG